MHATEDETSLAELEARATAPTATLLEQLFPFSPFPSKDAAGTLRHGIGRPIEKRPMPKEVAEMALAHDILVTQQALRGRVFELIARHPDFEARLPYLYALADIMGPDEMRNWNKFWTMLNARDLEGASAELIVANWDRLVGANEKSRKAVFLIINRLQNGATIQ